jgi:hypothetical protein
LSLDRQQFISCFFELLVFFRVVGRLGQILHSREDRSFGGPDCLRYTLNTFFPKDV